MSNEYITLIDDNGDPEDSVFAAPLGFPHEGKFVVRESNGEVVVSRDRLREWALKLIEATA